MQWDFNLGAGATKTVSVQWYFTAPAAPQAPVVTSVPTGTVNTTSAAPHFAPAAGDTQVVGYECKLDGGAFAPCTSPSSVTGLADGAHTYQVRATNSAGIAGPATTKSWTVDTTPPVAPSVTGAPTGTVATGAATLTLAGEAGATLKCSVDGGAYVTCTSPLSLTGLADGHHTVEVKQVDAAGNPGTLFSTSAWTVDTSVPAAPATDREPVDTVAHRRAPGVHDARRADRRVLAGRRRLPGLRVARRRQRPVGRHAHAGAAHGQRRGHGRHAAQRRVGGRGGPGRDDATPPPTRRRPPRPRRRPRPRPGRRSSRRAASAAAR